MLLIVIVHWGGQSQYRLQQLNSDFQVRGKFATYLVRDLNIPAKSTKLGVPSSPFFGPQAGGVQRDHCIQPTALDDTCCVRKHVCSIHEEFVRFRGRRNYTARIDPPPSGAADVNMVCA